MFFSPIRIICNAYDSVSQLELTNGVGNPWDCSHLPEFWIDIATASQK
jgi:hypothetical protein